MKDGTPIKVVKGHPRTFGYLKVSQHPDGSETWEAPDGTLRRFAPGKLELVLFKPDEDPGKKCN